MNRLKKGDKVRVISGSQKNKEGIITKILVKEQKAIVEGVNIYKRHKKSGPNNEESGIVDVTVPLHLSKLALIEPKAKTKITKVSYEYKNGIKNFKNKVRVSKATKNEIVNNK